MTIKLSIGGLYNYRSSEGKALESYCEGIRIKSSQKNFVIFECSYVYLQRREQISPCH